MTYDVVSYRYNRLLREHYQQAWEDCHIMRDQAPCSASSYAVSSTKGSPIEVES